MDADKVNELIANILGAILLFLMMNLIMWEVFNV